MKLNLSVLRDFCKLIVKMNKKIYIKNSGEQEKEYVNLSHHGNPGAMHASSDCSGEIFFREREREREREFHVSLI